MTNNNNSHLGLQMVDQMHQITQDRIGTQVLENASRNQQWLGKGQSLVKLRGTAIGSADSAIVIAAGPSVHKQHPIEQIIESGYKGALIATESSLSYMLKHDLVPDLVITLDPHPTRIVRWFGDPDLCQEKLDHDDYFSRQDMDPAFRDEMKANEQLLSLLDKHGHKIKIALSTSSSEAVVKRALETGMDIYWWNPMMDDPDEKDSVSRQLYGMNKLPVLNAGGNVGTAAWMMAHAVLGKSHVALTGVDFSYYADTPHRNTQYYDAAVKLLGEKDVEQIFIQVHNPHLDQWFYTDPAYYWYRNAFLDMVTDAECVTYNCTEGGILFGKCIEFIPLKAFLNQNI